MSRVVASKLMQQDVGVVLLAYILCTLILINSWSLPVVAWRVQDSKSLGCKFHVRPAKLIELFLTHETVALACMLRDACTAVKSFFFLPSYLLHRTRLQRCWLPHLLQHSTRQTNGLVYRNSLHRLLSGLDGFQSNHARGVRLKFDEVIRWDQCSHSLKMGAQQIDFGGDDHAFPIVINSTSKLFWSFGFSGIFLMIFLRTEPDDGILYRKRGHHTIRYNQHYFIWHATSKTIEFTSELVSKILFLWF